jgi:hypothetical protein
MADTVVQQARGIILDESNNYTPVCRPFDKFFNHGEMLAAKLDLVSTKLMHKLDGSLCSLYFHKGTWNVSTSGNPDAAGNVDRSGWVFRDLFWHAFNTQQLKLPTDITNTYMFELTSQHNRIVVRYTEPKLTLIGIRNTLSGQERDIYDVSGFPLPEIIDPFVGFSKSHAYVSTMIASAERYINTVNPIQLEGVVAVDKYFNRVKIKSVGYLRLHRIRGNESMPGDLNLLDIVLAGESEEIGTYFTEWKPKMDKFELAIKSFKMEIKDVYRKCFRLAYADSIGKLQSKPDVTPAMQRKTFAEHAKVKWYAALLFNLLKLAPTEDDLTTAINDLVSGMSEVQRQQLLAHIDEYK